MRASAYSTRVRGSVDETAGLGGNRDIMVEVSIDREMRAKEEMEEMV